MPLCSEHHYGALQVSAVMQSPLPASQVVILTKQAGFVVQPSPPKQKIGFPSSGAAEYKNILLPPLLKCALTPFDCN